MKETKKVKKFNGRNYLLHSSHGRMTPAVTKQRILKAEGYNARIVYETRSYGKGKAKAIIGYHVYKAKRRKRK